MADTWNLEGTYMEACSCKTGCPCVYEEDPTEGDCTTLVAWHIENGSYQGVDLADLSVVMATYSPGRMADGNWKAALYIDDRANGEQREALETIFSGHAGGHPSYLDSLISEHLGTSCVSIDYHQNGKERSLRFGDIGEASIEAQTGEDHDEVTIHRAPWSFAPGKSLVLAHSKQLRYRDHGYDWQLTQRNGYFSPFSYQGDVARA